MKVLVGKTIYNEDEIYPVFIDYHEENIENVIEKWKKKEEELMEYYGKEIWEKSEPASMTILCENKEEFVKTVKMVKSINFPIRVQYSGDVREIIKFFKKCRMEIADEKAPKKRKRVDIETFMKEIDRKVGFIVAEGIEMLIKGRFIDAVNNTYKNKIYKN